IPARSRVRFDMPGDAFTPNPTIDALQTGALASTPTVSLQGTADVRLAGSLTSLIPTGPYTVPMTQPVPAEAGVVLGLSPQGHVAQIIWPGPAGLPAGAPICRIQLVSVPVAVGTPVDLSMTVVAVDALGNTTTWVNTANGITVQ
ncbi:MAG: hypothetical protein JWM80_3916, partial [Cyanobacteria bacterium RYN_339]|nr:hypothetical protein [Cyanobacteria bacterium RYN_339]